jgi:hypothetical protein
MKKEKKRQARYYNRTAKDLHVLHRGDEVRTKDQYIREKRSGGKEQYSAERDQDPTMYKHEYVRTEESTLT